jgi:hypothetical protein
LNVSKPAQVSVTASIPPSDNGPIFVRVYNATGGLVAASSPSDNSNAGNWKLSAGYFRIRICSGFLSEDPATIPYRGAVKMGTLQSKPLPPGQVAGAAVTLSASAVGHAAIRTSHGLVWFTLTARHGQAMLELNDAARGVHRAVSAGLKPVFGVKSVTIRNAGLTFELSTKGVTEHILFRSPHYSASGNVVQGRFTFG